MFDFLLLSKAKQQRWQLFQALIDLSDRPKATSIYTPVQGTFEIFNFFCLCLKVLNVSILFINAFIPLYIV